MIYSFVIFDLLISIILLLLSDMFLKGVIVMFIMLYIWQLIRLFKKERRMMGALSLISFNTLFFAMYTFCTYFIPILILFDIIEETQFLLAIDFNIVYVPFALFLSSIAVSVYSWGYLKGISKPYKHSNKPLRNFNFILSLCNVMAFLVTVYFSFNFLEIVSTDVRDVSGKVGTLVNCFLILPVTLCGYMNKFYKRPLLKFIFKHWFLFLCIAYICVCMLSVGDRLMTICLFLPVAFIINEFVYKFKKIQVAVAAVIGVFFMFLISFTRGNSSLSQGVSDFGEAEHKIAFFQDVFPANATFILGTELYETSGLYKPMKIVPVLLTPIPFIPSLIENTFFNGSYSSAMYLTLANRKRSTVGESGIGTHVVVDILVSWGVIGVVLFFSVFGYIAGVSYCRRNSIYYLIITVGLVAWSIFMPRESMFDPYRDVVWMLLIASLLINISRKNESNMVQR